MFLLQQEYITYTIYWQAKVYSWNNATSLSIQALINWIRNFQKLDGTKMTWTSHWRSTSNKMTSIIGYYAILVLLYLENYKERDEGEEKHWQISFANIQLKKSNRHVPFTSSTCYYDSWNGWEFEGNKMRDYQWSHYVLGASWHDNLQWFGLWITMRRDFIETYFLSVIRAKQATCTCLTSIFLDTHLVLHGGSLIWKTEAISELVGID